VIASVRTTPATKCRFDVEDPRFARVQELFEKERPDEGRALLRELVDEFMARRDSKRRRRSFVA